MSEVFLAFLGQIYLTGLTCDDVQVLGADCRCSCVSTDQISVADWCQGAAQPLPVSVKKSCHWLHTCRNNFWRSLGDFRLGQNQESPYPTWGSTRVSRQSCRTWAGSWTSLHCYYKHMKADGFLIPWNAYWIKKKKKRYLCKTCNKAHNSPVYKANTILLSHCRMSPRCYCACKLCTETSLETKQSSMKNN